MLDYENEEIVRDKTKRIYPEFNWTCRCRGVVIHHGTCIGLDFCIREYPNLICEKGYRDFLKNKSND